MAQPKITFFDILINVVIIAFLGVTIYAGYYLFLDLYAAKNPSTDMLPRLIITVIPAAVAIYLSIIYSKIKRPIDDE